MISHKYGLGIDIGGSHITVGLYDFISKALIKCISSKVSSFENYSFVLKEWANPMKALLAEIPQSQLLGIGIAIPGPADYKLGLLKLSGLSKYDRLFGANLGVAIKDELGLKTDTPIVFLNDADAFALGTVQHDKDSSIVITLGTGFGSAFIKNGTLYNQKENIAEEALYKVPYQDSIIEDYLSTRFLKNRFAELSGEMLPDVESIVVNRNVEKVQLLFHELGERLGLFLKPYIKEFKPYKLIIGGGIAKSFSLFEKPLYQHIDHNIDLQVVTDTEVCTLMGAIKHLENTVSPNGKNFRLTSQPLMPTQKNKIPNDYDLYPTFLIDEDKILSGFDKLADEVSKNKTAVFEGYIGMLWDDFALSLGNCLKKKNYTVAFWDIRAALKEESQIDEMIGPFLGGADPLFGKICPISLKEFFVAEKIQRINPDPQADINILLGCGSSLAGWEGPLYYLDIPKNEIQFRSRAEHITNLGKSQSQPYKEIYKRFYFVDWPVLNRHKQQLLSHIDYIVDAQNPSLPTFMKRGNFHSSLNDISINAFRARPWFEPGVWGGKWIKQHIPEIRQDEVNYAWSFELIVPENGIVFQSGITLLEISFDFLMYWDNGSVLGNDAAKQFGYDFPIRFDYLDTFDGGNLSVQCHPGRDYIKEHFGESFTQDETYYILDCKPDAKVYLGFQEDIDRTEFESALRKSFLENKPIDIPKYVQVHEAHKHDLFLIPNSTIHCSGANNMVLEISATPYIYTFKMYDWLRPDLNGNPRPLNIDRAMQNLSFDRKGNYVKHHLISKPSVIFEEAGQRIVHLPTHKEHFYDVHRIEFTKEITIHLEGAFHVLNLVEGDQIEVLTNNRMQSFHFAETFVIPAAAQTYILRNVGKTQVVKVIKAFIKPSNKPL